MAFADIELRDNGTNVFDINLSSGSVSSDTQVIFLQGQSTSLDSQSIYTNASAAGTGISATQTIYLLGSSILIDNQSIYTQGKDTVSDSQAISLTSSSNITDNQPIYLRTPFETYTDGYGGDVNTAIDVNLHETAHTYNNGLHSAIQFGSYNYGLIKFNLSAIPAGSTVISAKLHLGLYEGAGNANIYAVLAANDGWIEGTGDFDLALEDEPCWDALQADGAGGVKTAWAGGSNGCGVVGTDISSDTIGTLTGTGIGVFEVDLDATTVQGWFGATNTNYGILIKPTSTNSNHIALSDYGTASYRPKLVVQYIESNTTTDSQSIYLKGLSTLTDTQPIYIDGQDSSVDSQNIYLRSEDVLSDTQSIYLKSENTLTDSQSIFLASDSTLTDTQNIFLESSADSTDTQSIYLESYDGLVDAQSIFLQGKSTSTDNQSIYTKGGGIWPFSDNFTGNNGDDWGYKWQVFESEGTVDIQSNQGRLTKSFTTDQAAAYANVENYKDLHISVDTISGNGDLIVKHSGGWQVDYPHLPVNGIAANIYFQIPIGYRLSLAEYKNSVQQTSTVISIPSNVGHLNLWTYGNKAYARFIVGGVEYSATITLVSTENDTGIASVVTSWTATSNSFVIDNFVLAIPTDFYTQPTYLKSQDTELNTQAIYLAGATFFPFTDDFTGSNDNPWDTGKWFTEAV